MMVMVAVCYDCTTKLSNSANILDAFQKSLVYLFGTSQISISIISDGSDGVSCLSL